jgi:hypothetical protein
VIGPVTTVNISTAARDMVRPPNSGSCSPSLESSWCARREVHDDVTEAHLRGRRLEAVPAKSGGRHARRCDLEQADLARSGGRA